jgi:hypothetical protein
MEGQSDDKPIVLQNVKSNDFECMVWMFYNELVSSTPSTSAFIRKGCSSCWNRQYADWTVSAGELSSIISLAHMWQFENMSQAAFKAYAALPNTSSMDKISMRRKYDFPRTELADAYVELCTRYYPISAEEGDRIGVEDLALIGQTREELRGEWRCSTTEKRGEVVIHNLIELPSKLIEGIVH